MESPKVERMDPEKGLQLSDTPWLNTPTPVFSGCVKKTMESLIGDAVEFLPIMFNEAEYWLVNVSNVLDCIDYEKAKVKRFSSGRVMLFERYSFIEEKVTGEDIFKICELPIMYPFVSDRFKEQIELGGVVALSLS